MPADFASAAAPPSSSGSEQLEICFAGIRFNFSGAARLLECVARGAGAVPSGALSPSASHRVFANLRCRLSPGDMPAPSAEPFGSETRQIAYEWLDGAEHALSWGANVRIYEENGGYAAEATLAPSRRAALNLLTSLAYALVRRAGGAVLHAASVEFPEGVVAFVGPSGAGKSTACEHAGEARLFSADRLAVVPANDGGAARPVWFAHPLPGGTPLVRGLPPSESAGRPLRAALRIRQASRGCWFEPSSGVAALALLRQSSFRPRRSPEREGELLRRLEQLASSVPIGNLHFSLGTPLGPLLRSWFSDGTSRRSGAFGAAE